MAPRKTRSASSKGKGKAVSNANSGAKTTVKTRSSTRVKPSKQKQTLVGRGSTRQKATHSVSDSEDERGALEARRPTTRRTPDRQDVLCGSYLSDAGGNASALSRRLKHMWEMLQRSPTRQQQRDDGITDAATPEQLQLVSAELQQERLLTHADANVKSLTACCLVELLRMHAPDTPFQSNEELYRVFQLLFQQLRCLADDGVSPTACNLQDFHVLETLATVKAGVLLVRVDYTTQEDEEPLLVQLFRVLFETLRSEHSVKMESLMLAIMEPCIDECDSVEQALLDVILAPLVNPPVDEENKQRGPYHMAQELIRRTSEQLQSSLSLFFNGILIDAQAGLGTQRSSELKEHVHTLIYEVHKVDTSLLLYVLPNVCLQLQVDEVATRSDAISLLGRLFASSHADYGQQYLKNFRDFLGRFRDASKEIRVQMVHVSVRIWERKSELANLLEHELELRLTDPEWEVRQAAVHALCDLAANNLELLSEECLRQVGERMKDKKVALRKETMTGLSQVYSTHISAKWTDVDEGKPLTLSHRHIPSAHIKKLGWIPDLVLKCFAYPEQELRLRVVQLLDDFLLPKALSERNRANGLLFLFHSLDAVAKEGLRRIWSERAKCQSACRAFADFKAQQRLRGSNKTDPAELEAAKQKLCNALSPLFSSSGNVNKLLSQLAKWKDRSVFRHLGELCDVSKDLAETRHARDQLIRCVGSKSPLGEFLKNLCRKLALLTVNQMSIATFLGHLIEKEGRPARENRSVLELLTMTSSVLPELFSPFIKEQFEAVLVDKDDSEPEQGAESDEDEEEPLRKDPKVVLGMLTILANFSSHWKKMNNRPESDATEPGNRAMPSETLVEHLRTFCLGKEETETLNPAMETQAAKSAALTLANFYGHEEETSSLINKLCAKESLASPETYGVASRLQSLEVFVKRCGHFFAGGKLLPSELWTALMDGLIAQSGEPAEPDSSTPSTARQQKQVALRRANVRCLAVKTAVNLLVYTRSVGGPVISREESARLIQLLFGILRSDGKTWATNAAVAATFRATAACGLLKLMRNRQLEAAVAVSEWHLLGFSMQDSSEEVRRQFVKKLTSHLLKQTAPHPHKYLSYLVLAATETNASIKKSAKNLMKLAVERMRRVFDASSSRQSDTPSSPGQVGNALIVPEYALPYVLHLLAHHPQFPTKLVARTPVASVLQSGLWTPQLTYLSFFLDVLISAKSAAADNIAFLLQILTKLSACHDITAPDSKNLYPLIDSAVALLKKKIRKQSNLKPYPGKIYLPKNLYGAGRRSRQTNIATSASTTEPAPITASGRVEKSGRNIGASLSPIKPADFAAHFMRLNSPPGSSLKKRKPSSAAIDERRTSNASAGVQAKKTRVVEAGGVRASRGDEIPAVTPPRRQSLMRKHQTQQRTFADESSDSGVDSDDLLTGAGAVAHLGKRQNSHVSAEPEEEEKENEEAEEKRSTTGRAELESDVATQGMASFRSTRRRQRS